MAMAHANQKAVPTFSECSRSRRSPEFCLVASLTVHSGVMAHMKVWQPHQAYELVW